MCQALVLRCTLEGLLANCDLHADLLSRICVSLIWPIDNPSWILPHTSAALHKLNSCCGHGNAV